MANDNLAQELLSTEELVAKTDEQICTPRMSQTIQCIVLLLCCTCAVFAAQKDMEHYTFDAFVSEFRKSYSPDEHARRKSIFDTRLDLMQTHNANPESSYKLGVNAFSDMHESERRIR